MREIASNRRKRSRGTKTKDREHSSLLQRKCVVYDIASANRFYRGRYTISRAQLAPTEEDIQYREHSSLLQRKIYNIASTARSYNAGKLLTISTVFRLTVMTRAIRSTIYCGSVSQFGSLTMPLRLSVFTRY